MSRKVEHKCEYRFLQRNSSPGSKTSFIPIMAWEMTDFTELTLLGFLINGIQPDI